MRLPVKPSSHYLDNIIKVLMPLAEEDNSQ